MSIEELWLDGKALGWPYPVEYESESEVNCDVLILGGGIAGCRAAIIAARMGLKVVIVEKGSTIRSGSGGAGCDHWLYTANPLSAVEPEEMVDAEAIEDPAHGGECNGICAFWRPFVDAARIKAPMLLPILPLPIPPAPAVVVFMERPSKTVQPSDICSPMSLIAIKRGIFDLIRFMRETDRHLWTEFDDFTIWHRYGPYLRLNIDRKDFSPLFHDLLEDGIVISPFFTKPSIVPAIFTPGELKHLHKYRRTGDTNGNR